MKKQANKLANLFIRYLIILFAGLGNLAIFYKIFTPLTIQAVAFLFSIFTKTSISANFIITQKIIIEIIPACVAGSAYYLLLILIFSTPQIKFYKRVQLILFSFASLFILNVIRIIILALTGNSVYYTAIHLIFWYFVSTLFVVAIWIASVKIFKIKSVPVYSDIKFVYKLVNSGKKSQRRK